MAMYVATYLIDIAALFYLMGLLYSSTSLNSERKKPFLIAILLTVAIIFAEAGTLFIDSQYMNLRNLLIFCNVIGFSFSPMIPIVITFIFDRRILKNLKVLLIPTLINIGLCILSPFYGFIFHVDFNNQYVRGDFFFMFVAVYSFNFLLLIMSTLITGKAYNYPMMRKLIALFVFTIIGTSVQLVNPAVYSSWHSVTLSLFLYFVLMSEFDSSFDTLTGLYNRSTFDKTAKQVVGLKSFSIIILDINDFKNINDTYGHDFGDKVIKTVAAVVRNSFNKNYTCYRFGGDEFSIITYETDVEKIELQLKVLTKALSEVREDGTPLPTVAYGYSLCKDKELQHFDQVLKEADDQMYLFKKAMKQEKKNNE
jgi:diguanylate cyclase (GGDEF)-like protein